MSPRRLAAIRALAERPGTPSEGEVARARLRELDKEEWVSDAELICSWMQPKPSSDRNLYDMDGWWFFRNGSWHPRILTLDLLRQVEQKLIDQNKGHELDSLLCEWREYTGGWIWHVDAIDRIKAVAHILRSS